MKKYLLAAAALSLAVASPAQAGWFSDTFCNCNGDRSSSYSSDNDFYYGYNDEGKWYGRLDTGTETMIGLGYYWLDELRLDLTLNVGGYLFDPDTSTAGATADSSLSGAVMFNIYYDWINSTNWTPYVMLGAGYSSSEVEAKLGGVSAKKREGEFAYQGGLGVAYRFNNDWFADLGYRYASYGSQDFDILVSGTNVKAELDNPHMVTIGLRCLF